MTVLIAVVGGNVFFRYVLGSPIPWAEEVARYTMIYMAYLAAPLALREGRHIRITVLTDRLRGAWATAFDMIAHLLVAGFAVAVVYHGWSLTQLVSFQVSPALRLSMSVPYFAVVLGAAFLALEALLLFAFGAARFVGSVREARLAASASAPKAEGLDP